MIFVNERVSVVHLLIIIVVAYLVYTGTVRLGSVFGAVFLAFLGILAFYLVFGLGLIGISAFLGA
jgi:hypothetical protein